MVYDPTIPALNNYVGDDIPKIMANFVALAGSRIVEMGSNSNGEYVRWENGLQVCWVRSPLLALDVTEVANVLWAKSWIWNFPASYIAPPRVSLGIEMQFVGTGVALAGSYRETTTTQAFLVAVATRRDQFGYIIGVAIGRWK